MSHSTGLGCNTVKNEIRTSVYVENANLIGSLTQKDNLSEGCINQLDEAGCDSAVFQQEKENVKVYFSCCCAKGSVVYLEAILKDKSTFPQFKNEILAAQEKIKLEVA